MNKLLRALLEKIHSDNMKNQKEILRSTFLDWKRDTQQTDDVTVMGFNIN